MPRAANGAGPGRLRVTTTTTTTPATAAKGPAGAVGRLPGGLDEATSGSTPRTVHHYHAAESEPEGTPESPFGERFPRAPSRSNSGIESSWRVESFYEVLLLLTASSRSQRAALRGQLGVLLKEATEEELNEMVQSSEDYMAVFWQTAGTANVKALKRRLNHLTVEAKITFLKSIMKARGRLSSLEFVASVREVFLSTRGTDLTDLKNAIDGNGTYRNMSKLLYEDIPNLRQQYRIEIIQHLAVEAKKVRRTEPNVLRVKVVSDVDDTLWSSGGHFPAGIDTRLPKHVFYPGVFALYRELAFGTGGRLMQDMTREALGADHTLDGSSLVLSDAIAQSPRSGSEHSRTTSNADSFTHWMRDKGATVFCTTNPDEPGIGDHPVSMKVSVRDSVRGVWVKMMETAQRPLSSLSLAVGSKGLASVSAMPAHSLVMLSARPKTPSGIKGAGGLFENVMYRRFSKLFASGKFESMPTLLCGDMFIGLRSMLLGILEQAGITDKAYVWRGVGAKKTRDLFRYMDLYPEYDFIFFGDDGQADEQTAVDVINSHYSMLRSRGARLLAAFIHRVDVPENQPTMAKTKSALFSGLSKRQRQSSLKAISSLHKFENYVEAAHIALNLELISMDGLYKVAVEAVDDALKILRRAQFKHKAWRANHGQELIDMLNRSLQQANDTLPFDLQVPLLPPLDRITTENDQGFMSSRDVQSQPGSRSHSRNASLVMDLNL